jgi:hypothetical protein
VRHGISIALAVLAALATASCTANGADSPAPAGKKQATFAPLPGGNKPPLDPKIVAAADPRQVTMPLSAYSLDDAGARIVSRARIIVGDKCMAAYGFAPMAGWRPEGAVVDDNWSRWGVWDATLAADQGYLPTADDGGNSYPVRYLSIDALTVYYGQVKEYRGQAVPVGGCGGQEAKAVLTGVTSDGHLEADLDSEARARAAQDHRVVVLIAAWRTCMHNAGWHFTDPQAPIEYWAGRRTGDKFHPDVTAAEKANALADIGCKKSTGLLGTWLAADVAYQKALIERDATRLAAYRQDVDNMVARADVVIAHG